MTTQDILMFPTLDKTKQYEAMLTRQQKRNSQEIQRIQMVSALMCYNVKRKKATK